ncbi:DUF1835 domain-containing protein [Paraburkholderia sp. Ac-20336]|uniref:DUF1835 domain-containing protein n=1 Tax=Burkholderiaceae TaxID=119060 RepID=UPI0014247FEA|nr:MULTISPECIES: DUF1835 domain-containing protein [Burkholderiaceae]MBN3804710.1 DUF1835 domain-containing protein [Paraburkholderia sp. Ac-20336]MBN3849283.1 DUF1835 domain-containing protein [Paraburkholderia sp. Ac-20342]NIF55296.1 DUF1835 domain-containing protein [Burkholderia sp. Ax-1724]NIF79939.1 DUF1835 domain-containing protein [Paraburkholderia sp. Cy-641]
MSTIHLTNGDVAAESLRSALAQAGRDDRVQALRDDLAVGPLRGIDDGPDMRADFWERVSADTKRNFLQEFRDQAAALNSIANGTANLVVWHGESSSDQLMLRRVCYYLRNSPQRLNEVRLSIADLTDPLAWAHTRKDRATSVGMFAPDVLQSRLPDAAPISVLRISRLALEWQEVKHANGETRRWRDNTFTSSSFAELDALILDHAAEAWQPAARIAAGVMSAELWFLVSDSIVLWRLRELAARRRIRLRGDTNAWRSLELCATFALRSNP